MREFIEQAARKLVAGFTPLDHDDLIGRWARYGEELFAIPMHGTVFEVHDPCDIRAIRKLESTPLDSIASMVKHAADHGFDFAPIDFVETDEECCEDPEPRYVAETDNVRCSRCGFYFDSDAADEAWLDAWRDSDPDGAALFETGWREVADTGILMIDGPDGGVYLGIDGGGYSFYDDHWTPLYVALGYSWHENYAREDRISKAASAVYRAIDSDDLPAALALLRSAFEA